VNTFVVDSSAVVRLYVPDGPVPQGLEDAIESAWRAESVIMVPELALVEVAQLLHKKVKARLLSVAEADEILAAVLDLPLELIGHRELLPAAVEQARRFGVTVYDAVFLALAIEHHAQLISADVELTAAWTKAAER